MVTQKIIYKYIAVFNIFSFTILIGLFLVTQRVIKEVSANQFAHTSRNNILAENKREVESSKRSLLGDQFLAVEYFSREDRISAQKYSILTDKITIPIRYGDHNSSNIAGHLIFIYKKFSTTAYPLLATLLMLFLFSFPLGFKIQKRLNDNQQKEIEAKRNQAVALTTQGLAHDIRKPFTLIKLALDLIGTKKPDEIKDFLKMMVPEVDKTIATANGMITDIMEISSKAKLNLEPVSPETLIENVLTDSFLLFPKSKITISYDLNHDCKVMVDPARISRVFGNIVGNAIQAMRRKGSLWFNTKIIDQSGEKYIEFEIGNSGTYIPPEDANQVFDFFFTKNKKGGTGLGLAIAKKLVEEHLGKIRCESKENIGTSFILTLPAYTATIN